MSAETSECVKAQVLQSLKEKVAPEFLNRINEIIMFQPLDISEIRKIVCAQLTDLSKKLKTKNIYIHYDDTVIDYITNQAFAPEYGARPVARAITLFITDEIINKLDNHELKENHPIHISALNSKLIFESGL